MTCSKRRAVVFLAAYAVLVVWLTWPLAARMTTHLPAPHPRVHFDTLFAAWSLAWESHSLVDSPSQLFEANSYHPSARALFYGPMGIGVLPYFLPVFLVTGNPALALNLTFLSSVVLTAWVIHLVVVRWTSSSLAGALSAWTFLTTRWTLWEWPAITPLYAVLQYLPLIVLLTAAPALRVRASLGLFALIVLQGATDLYVAAAVLACLGLLTLTRLLRPATRGAALPLLGAVVASSVVLLGTYAGQLLIQAENPGLRRQTLWWFPNYTSLPWGPFGRGAFGFMAPTAAPLATFAVIAAGAVALCVTTRSARAPLEGLGWRHASLWTAVGTLLTLTPAFFWRGELIEIPLLLDWIPQYRALRTPSRLGVVALIGLSLLAGVAFSECVRTLGRNGKRRGVVLSASLALVLASLMYADYSTGLGRPEFLRESLPGEYPLKAAISPDSHLVEVLRTSDGPVLELPLGPHGTEPGPHARAMYRSIFHWRPLLNGYGSYWPRGFPRRMALARALPASEALARLCADTDLETVVVHLDATDPEARAEWSALAKSGSTESFRLMANADGALIFEVTAPSCSTAREARARASRLPEPEDPT